MRPIRIPAAAIIFAIFLSFGVAAARYAGVVGTIGPPGLIDFDSFYIAAQLVLSHNIQAAYHLVEFSSLQRLVDTTTDSYMPWAYPPQYDIMVAPLALLPRGAAYIAFVGTTLVAYLFTLRHLTRESFSPVVMLVYLPVLVNISTGQNGFLTASFIGVACLLLLQRSAWAGVPLGLMIIKPHLAIAVALWVLLDRQWRTAAVAVATIVVTSLIATAVLGTGVWSAFAAGLTEAESFMARGVYPFYRMVSIYAAARTVGATLPIAGVLQAVIAGCALVAVVAAHRRFAARISLGIAVTATLLISPYAYDYDLPIVGVGIALLWSGLRGHVTRFEAIALGGLCFASGAFGFVQSFRAPVVDPRDLLTLAGPCLAAGAGWVYHVLVRPKSGQAEASDDLPSATLAS